MTRHVLLLVAALLPAAVHGQTAEIRGRVVETGTRREIAAAAVSVEGGGNVRSDQDGQFRLRAVRTGRVALRVSALGYETAEVVLVLARDTSLVIELEPAPIALDAVEGRARNITLRGEVRDRASNAVLMHTEVAVGERSTQTDLLGRFKLNRVLAGEAVTVGVRTFGYLPATLSFTASRDTTLHFLLDPDPVRADR